MVQAIRLVETVRRTYLLQITIDRLLHLDELLKVLFIYVNLLWNLGRDVLHSDLMLFKRQQVLSDLDWTSFDCHALWGYHWLGALHLCASITLRNQHGLLLFD